MWKKRKNCRYLRKQFLLLTEVYGPDLVLVQYASAPSQCHVFCILKTFSWIFQVRSCYIAIIKFKKKVLSRLCSPKHNLWAEVWRAEALQSSTLTSPPARGSSNALLFQFLYIWRKKLHLLPCATISSILTMGSLVLVLSLLWSSAIP